MRLLAILILGAGMAWWFLLRPPVELADTSSAGNEAGQTQKTAQISQNQPRPAPQATSSPSAKPSPPADASSLVKRPIDRARQAIDANQKRLEDGF